MYNYNVSKYPKGKYFSQRFYSSTSIMKYKFYCIQKISEELIKLNQSNLTLDANRFRFVKRI